MLGSIAQSDAEYTAAIAMSAKRDGIAMKTISTLGIVFLPGTFIATVFSVGMFDWGSADDEGLRVSPSMWIYWAVTIPLTAVTMLIWILWSSREMSRSGKRLVRPRFLRSNGSQAAGTMGLSHSLGEKMV